MAKNLRIKIKLISSLKTGHYYTTTKNKSDKNKKLELKKYDPIARKKAIYKEYKIR
ncbi:MAG: 50S ribosomal protein L33 [Buchnera aphidicola (Periphyllus lyropictus)]|uniref:50S ribosomal protein L33 n=1 Tax=Buchnera aphidicola TaxID=9 RepID=UPI001ED2B2F1|nr:50S ribosomal protein L33 [Buchnera aphidicola]NIH16745.1 50S ribosomal protein L33 [Buchnera aphidicola (Periphyllus lyropictus)]USS94645.1 50S ribosomal protein L33 [Buchnera aphidicola (Periphyllus lyropictus)]